MANFDWDAASADEKLEWLRGQINRLLTDTAHKSNQIGGLQLTVNEIGAAVTDLERKLGSNK